VFLTWQEFWLISYETDKEDFDDENQTTVVLDDGG